MKKPDAEVLAEIKKMLNEFIHGDCTCDECWLHKRLLDKIKELQGD